MVKKTAWRALVAVVAGGTLALTGCSGGAPGDSGSAGGETITLNAATMVLPQTPNAPVEQWFYDQIEERSDGRIIVDRTAPESICKAPEIAVCVGDGRADIGVSISDYTPQLFPSMSVATIPFLSHNAQAMMQSLVKVNKENESAAALWDQSGLELISAWSAGKAIIGANKPVDSIDDLKGLKTRVTGAILSEAFNQVGANVVAMPAAETYEGIERGVADAVSWTIDGPVDYKMMEQLDTWVDAGVGHYTTFAMWMNSDVYNDMPEDLRGIIDEVRDELNAGAGMEAFNTVTEAQCDTLINFPNTKRFYAWDDAATQEWQDAVQEDLITAWIAQAEESGLTDAQGYFDQYVSELEAASASPDIVKDPVPACIAQFQAK